MVVLINTAGTVSPAALASDIVDLVLGEPAPPETGVYPGDVSELVGTYRGPSRGIPLILTVEADSAGIAVRRGRGNQLALSYVDGLTFVRGNTRYIFERREGSIAELKVDQVSGLYVLRRVEQ